METESRAPNRLIHEKSPYLHQHAYNPIGWYPWGEEAFAEAVRRDVPIFLSIGYASCHWCHVMAAESFEDPIVAELLNQHYVPIKVDREQRPDVDALYMQACIALQGQGGWPLSVFLLPDRRPFYAGSYFPPTSQGGQMGLRALLSRIGSMWQDHREQALAWADQLARAMAITGSVPPKYPQALPSRLEAELLRAEDKTHGGIGNAPKFPNLTLIRFLIDRAQARPAEDAAWQMVARTLEALASGGIRDHVGNGFFRYTVDAAWRTPHYEKMLQDNALLALTALDCRAVLGDWVDKLAKSALDYMIDWLLGDHGGCASSQDADDPGGEGAYYLWTTDEVQAVLGERDGDRFCSLFGLKTPLTEGLPREKRSGRHTPKCDPKTGCSLDGGEALGALPHRAAVFSEADETFAQFALSALRRQREGRQPPRVIGLCPLLGNGLAIAALASAARVYLSAPYQTAAVRIAQFVEQNLDIDGRLMGSWSDGSASGAATLDGYAAWVWGLRCLHTLTPSQGWLEKAVYWNGETLRLFCQPDGRMTLTGSDMHDLPISISATSDDAMPSGVAMTVENLLGLRQATDDERFLFDSDRILNAAMPHIAQQPMAHAGLVAAYMRGQES